MYRAILIDDEPLALEGLQLLIDWEGAGFEVTGAYGDPNIALEAIINQSPDLVVTDLYMPSMGGLELMDAARARGYTGKFIIVSGYSDFDMARKAIRIGVIGYLLKPILPEDAGDTLARAKKELESDEQERKLSDGAPNYQAELTALLSGLKYRREALPEGGVWQLATWGAPIAYAESLRILDETDFGGAKCSLHIIDRYEWLALYGSEAISAEIRDGLRARLEAQGREIMLCEPTWDVRQLYSQREALCASMTDCKGELARRVTEAARAISLLDGEGAMRMIGELELFAKTRGAAILSHAQALMYAECARMLIDGQGALRPPTAEGGSSQLRAMAMTTLDMLSPNHSNAVLEVMRLTRERYDGNITLDELSAVMGYNAAYLGRLFRKETGKSYRGWLCEYRMDKAAALLRDTDAPVAEIAARVGYRKYENFLEHFKDAFDMTPEQYRKG